MLASHYHLAFFINEHNIYLQNSECASVTLPPAGFHYWAWHLFVEWWICLRHTTTYSFSLLSTNFIYRMVNVLASHYRLEFFIINHDINLQMVNVLALHYCLQFFIIENDIYFFVAYCSRISESTICWLNLKSIISTRWTCASGW